MKLSDFYTPEELADLSEKVAKAQVDFWHSNNMARGTNYGDKATATERRFFDSLADEYFEKLSEADLDEQKLATGYYSTLDLANIANGTYTPPELDNAKLIDSVNSLWNEDGTMIPIKANEAKFAKTAKEAGYDWGDKEQRSQFMSAITDFKILENRAKYEQEYTNSPLGIAQSILQPTTYAEARKQLATGEGTQGDILASTALDVGRAGLIMSAPYMAGAMTTGLTASPIVTNLVGGALQGAFQAGAEGIEKAGGLGDEEFNIMPIVGSSVVGSTTPAIKGFVKGGATSLGGAGKRFSRGIELSTRGVKETPKDLATRMGKETGDILGVLGGSVEPAFRVEPNDVVDIFKGEYKSPDYKQSNWYKRLTPEARKAYDKYAVTLTDE